MGQQALMDRREVRQCADMSAGAAVEAAGSKAAGSKAAVELGGPGVGPARVLKVEIERRPKTPATARKRPGGAAGQTQCAARQAPEAARADALMTPTRPAFDRSDSDPVRAYLAWMFDRATELSAEAFLGIAGGRLATAPPTDGARIVVLGKRRPDLLGGAERADAAGEHRTGSPAARQPAPQRGGAAPSLESLIHAAGGGRGYEALFAGRAPVSPRGETKTLTALALGGPSDGATPARNGAADRAPEEGAETSRPTAARTLSADRKAAPQPMAAPRAPTVAAGATEQAGPSASRSTADIAIVQRPGGAAREADALPVDGALIAPTNRTATAVAALLRDDPKRRPSKQTASPRGPGDDTAAVRRRRRRRRDRVAKGGPAPAGAAHAVEDVHKHRARRRRDLGPV